MSLRRSIGFLLTLAYGIGGMYILDWQTPGIRKDMFSHPWTSIGFIAAILVAVASFIVGRNYQTKWSYSVGFISGIVAAVLFTELFSHISIVGVAWLIVAVVIAAILWPLTTFAGTPPQNPWP